MARIHSLHWPAAERCFLGNIYSPTKKCNLCRLLQALRQRYFKGPQLKGFQCGTIEDSIRYVSHAFKSSMNKATTTSNLKGSTCLQHIKTKLYLSAFWKRCSTQHHPHRPPSNMHKSNQLWSILPQYVQLWILQKMFKRRIQVNKNSSIEKLSDFSNRLLGTSIFDNHW